jgi:hypothetical protein
MTPFHSRRRRATMLAAGALTAAALLAPAGAFAGWSSYDADTGNTDPAGYGSAPDQPQSQNSSDPCKWIVSGRLYVRDPTLGGIPDGEPLDGVEIRVSGASSIGSALGAFGTWGTTHTDANGEFSVAHIECDKRRVLVEAKFESASGDLRVLGASSPEWYVLKDTNDLWNPGTVDLKGEPFGGETGDQATGQARTDAQDWVLYRKALDYAASLGYPFLNPVTVNNPASIHAGDNSWTDTVFHGIHIAPKWTNTRWNLLHELGHAWAYPRESGEGCLAGDALGTGSTHSQTEEPCVAFNEGFADFFASKLDDEMTAAGLISPTTPSWSGPYSRSHLVKEGVLNLDDASHNELGFDQAFRVLTHDDIAHSLFGDGLGPVFWALDNGLYAGSNCASMAAPQGLDGLATALKVVGSADDEFDAHGDFPTIHRLFVRADERLSKFDDWDATNYEEIVDPASDTEPHELYAC